MKMKRICLLCLLFAAVGNGVRADTNETGFHFVQITDTHVGSNSNDARSLAIVDLVNALPMPLACVLHTGDVVSDNIADAAVLATATSVLARLKAPLHFLPGNHDILRKNLPATLNVYTNTFGPLCGRVEYGGVVFLLMDTEPLRKGFAIEGYDPLQWLEEALREAGARPVILCLHAPPVEDFYGNRMYPGWPPAARERFEQLVNAANVKGVLSGHFHRDELHWLGKVPVFVSAPVADYWGRQGSFRLYEYRDGRLSYRTIYLEGGDAP